VGGGIPIRRSSVEIISSLILGYAATASSNIDLTTIDSGKVRSSQKQK